MIMNEYLYQVGDVVNGVVITSQCYKTTKDSRKKGYKYRCTKCGYDCGEYYKSGVYHSEHIATENNLKRGGCAICSKNGFVAPNINSIHILNPFIKKFLAHQDDAIKYSPYSDKKVQCKCPDCGKEYTKRCGTLSYYGLSCSCGDGFSYPEKFILNMLEQLSVKFKPQHRFNGSLLRYDYYLQDYDVILEVNGEQHYKQKWDRNEVMNDIKKKEFALSQGIKEENYIVLDCSESNSEFIKQTVLNSRLNTLFACDDIDFVKCSTFALNNLSKVASELWNDGCSVQEITDQLRVHKHTTIKYLKQGNDVGWCDYKPGDGLKRVPAEQRIKNLYKTK